MIRRLLLLGVGGAAGYVLGTRAGRARYEQIAARTRDLLADTGISDATQRVADRAGEIVSDVKDTAASATKARLGKAADSFDKAADQVQGAVAEKVDDAGAAEDPDVVDLGAVDLGAAPLGGAGADAEETVVLPAGDPADPAVRPVGSV